MQHAVRKRFAVSMGAVCLVCLYVTVPAFAQSDTVPRKVSKSGKADQELPLNGFVRVDDDCAGIGPPRINLDRPPAHGVVCLRPAEVVLKVLVKGTPARCLGRKALGAVSFIVRMMGIRVKTRLVSPLNFLKSQMTLDVDVTIVPNGRPAIKTAPADAGAPAEQTPQVPGPLPVCAALVVPDSIGRAKPAVLHFFDLRELAGEASASQDFGGDLAASHSQPGLLAVPAKRSILPSGT